MEQEPNELNAKGYGEAAREKYWNEITTDEKVERMRNEVKRALRQIDDQWTRLHKMTEIFRKHNHLEGKLVSQVDEYFDLGANVGLGRVAPYEPDPDKVYF